MRLSDLLHSRVVDADGEDLGTVEDVRLVQDGPVNVGFDAGLRVDGLLVGRGALAVRLGYHRAEVKAPWLLRALFTRLERRARFVPFEDVEAWEDDVVRLRTRRADLARVTDV